MVWGFVVVAFMTMLVGLAMAGASLQLYAIPSNVSSCVTSEICSAHPTSGGPYFWFVCRAQSA